MSICSKILKTALLTILVQFFYRWLTEDIVEANVFRLESFSDVFLNKNLFEKPGASGPGTQNMRCVQLNIAVKKHGVRIINFI